MGTSTSKLDKTHAAEVLLSQAIQNGDVAYLRKIKDKSLLTSKIKVSGILTTPLHIAALLGQTECLEYLLAVGANVHATDISRETALHFAVMPKCSASLDCLKILLREKSDINFINIWKRTPLLKAIVNFKFEAAKYLIQEGCDIDIADENGFTSLRVAASYNNIELATALVQNNANINAQDTRGRTALYFAILGGHTDMTEYLVNSGCDVNLYDEAWGSPLQLAVTKCNIRVLTLLLKTGAVIKLEVQEGSTSHAFLGIAMKIVNKRVNHFRGEMNKAVTSGVHNRQVQARANESLDVLRMLIIACGSPLKEKMMAKIHNLVTQSYHKDLHQGMMSLHSCAAKAHLPAKNTPLSLQQMTRNACRHHLMDSKHNVIWACEHLDVPRVIKDLCTLQR